MGKPSSISRRASRFRTATERRTAEKPQPAFGRRTTTRWLAKQRANETPGAAERFIASQPDDQSRRLSRAKTEREQAPTKNEHQPKPKPRPTMRGPGGSLTSSQASRFEAGSAHSAAYSHERRSRVKAYREFRPVLSLRSLLVRLGLRPSRFSEVYPNSGPNRRCR